MKNSKTFRSFDTATVCPKVEKGKGCPYCYVEAARKKGIRAKAVIREVPYTMEVLRYQPSTIEKLMSGGGMRMFSFSDYRPEHDEWVRRFLDDCSFRRLDAKTVTKVPLFVEKHHDHPALSVIHLSVDRVGFGVNLERARKMRDLYDKVRIRAVCLGMEDLEWFGSKDWCDILTLNHGQNGYHRFTNAEREGALRKYPGRLCCATHVCVTCPIQCAAGGRAER